METYDIWVIRDAAGHIAGVSYALIEGVELEQITTDTYAEYLAYINPPPTPPPPYVILADIPWTRMTEDEADLVQGGIDASPTKTRNMINKATSFTFGTDAFNKFLAIITTATDSARADEILGPLLPSEMATIELV